VGDPLEPDAFDTGHARATAVACERAAARLADARHGQAADATRALDGWQGPRRDDVVLRLAGTTRRSERLEAVLRALAAELRAAAREQART
jgi:hypothetical protein